MDNLKTFGSFNTSLFIKYNNNNYISLISGGFFQGFCAVNFLVVKNLNFDRILGVFYKFLSGHTVGSKFDDLARLDHL